MLVNILFNCSALTMYIVLSKGAVMTEIDLAQRKLLDDETGHNADRGMPSPSAVQGAQSPRIDKSRTVECGIANTNVNASASVEECATYYSGPGNSLNESGDQPPSTYNFFDSFLIGSSGPSTTDHNSPIKKFEIEQAHGLQKTPVRSHSLGVASFSPHDTEPISSLASPMVTRAKSDIPSGSAQQQQQLALDNVVDESTASVAVEIPDITENPEGNRSEVVLEDGNEDDNLALPRTQENLPGENTGEIQEQRTIDRDNENANVARSDSRTLPQVTFDASKEHLDAADPPRDAPSEQNIYFMEPEKTRMRTKEPKKKKLKRGKTSSAVLKKTYESDVEDDVIWVDEKPVPSNPGEFRVKANTAKDVSSTCSPEQSKVKASSSDHSGGISGTDGELNSEPVTDSGSLHSVQVRKEPKKRERKRKKTTEGQDEESYPNKEQQHGVLQDISNNASELNQHDHDQKHGGKAHASDLEKGATSPLTKTMQERHESMHNIGSTAEPGHAASATTTTTKTKDAANDPETPKRQQQQQRQEQKQHDEAVTTNATITDSGKGVPGKDPQKGPDKHSPISTCTTSRVPLRVGLSRKARIAPLLKAVKR